LHLQQQIKLKHAHKANISVNNYAERDYVKPHYFKHVQCSILSVAEYTGNHLSNARHFYA